jgi:hypothetical protein
LLLQSETEEIEEQLCLEGQRRREPAMVWESRRVKRDRKGVVVLLVVRLGSSGMDGGEIPQGQPLNVPTLGLDD